MTPEERDILLARICSEASPIMPVLVIKDAEDALELAKAFLGAGITVLEVALRTPDALKAIRRITSLDGLTIGAGTVLCKEDIVAAKAAGAVFGASPGATPELLEAAEQAGFALLAGSATPSEVMGLAARGIRVQKFFPARAIGGVDTLKSLYGPLSDIRFCPTGGITLQNAAEFLALPNVLCVGGSWLTPRTMIEAKNWKAITKLARESKRALEGNAQTPRDFSAL